jgi:hypothetical protein
MSGCISEALTRCEVRVNVTDYSFKLDCRHTHIWGVHSSPRTILPNPTHGRDLKNCFPLGLCPWFGHCPETRRFQDFDYQATKTARQAICAAHIDGPVLISASNLSGVEFGPGSLDPYGQFRQLVPTAMIQHGVFVFDGHFDVPLASALSRMQKAQNYLVAKQPEQALAEAQAAVTLAPNAVQTQMMLGDVFGVMGQTEQARAAYEKALVLANTIEPEFQIRSIPSIEQKLKSVPKVSTVKSSGL